MGQLAANNPLHSRGQANNNLPTSFRRKPDLQHGFDLVVFQRVSTRAEPSPVGQHKPLFVLLPNLRPAINNIPTMPGFNSAHFTIYKDDLRNTARSKVGVQHVFKLVATGGRTAHRFMVQRYPPKRAGF